MNLATLILTLEILFGKEAIYRLLAVNEWREFNNNGGDRKLLGVKYEVAELDSVTRFWVKVPNSEPVISNEQVQKSDKNIFVTFENSEVKLYGKSTFDLKLSVKAESIKLCK